MTFCARIGLGNVCGLWFAYVLSCLDLQAPGRNTKTNSLRKYCVQYKYAHSNGKNKALWLVDAALARFLSELKDAS